MARALGSYPGCRGFKSPSRYQLSGPVVKRLRHRPFTAVTRVRFSSGSPSRKPARMSWFSVFSVYYRTRIEQEGEPGSGSEENAPVERFRRRVLTVENIVERLRLERSSFSVFSPDCGSPVSAPGGGESSSPRTVASGRFSSGSPKIGRRLQPLPIFPSSLFTLH